MDDPNEVTSPVFARSAVACSSIANKGTAPSPSQFGQEEFVAVSRDIEMCASHCSTKSMGVIPFDCKNSFRTCFCSMDLFLLDGESEFERQRPIYSNKGHRTIFLPFELPISSKGDPAFGWSTIQMLSVCCWNFQPTAIKGIFRQDPQDSWLF